MSNGKLSLEKFSSSLFTFTGSLSLRLPRPPAATRRLAVSTWWRRSSNTASSKAVGWASSVSCDAIPGVVPATIPSPNPYAL